MELFICVQNGDVLDRILENANSFSFIITWKLRLRVAQLLVLTWIDELVIV